MSARSAFKGKNKNVSKIQRHVFLGRLEEAVFSIDTDAFFITESTFSVIGKGFSRRKLY